MPEYESKSVFARNLVRLLAASGETQSELAALLGVSKSTVSSWCSGAKMPRMDKIEAIAAHFEVPKSALLEQDGALVFDDFTYAFFDEAHGLTHENKQKLLEMARFFKQVQQQEQPQAEKE